MIVEGSLESIRVVMFYTYLFSKPVSLFILILKVEIFYGIFVEDCSILKSKSTKFQVPLHVTVFFGNPRVFIQLF